MTKPRQLCLTCRKRELFYPPLPPRFPPVPLRSRLRKHLSRCKFRTELNCVQIFFFSLTKNPFFSHYAKYSHSIVVVQVSQVRNEKIYLISRNPYSAEYNLLPCASCSFSFTLWMISCSRASPPAATLSSFRLPLK